MSAQVAEKPLAKRGTSNGNSSGSSYNRRARKAWLIETYRANQDLGILGPCNLGWGDPACRCYRCGELLTFETITVDRIIPGCLGGTYRRTNIRPACGPCNSETGGKLAHLPKSKRVRRKNDSQGGESPSRGSSGVRAAVDVESADRDVVSTSASRPASTSGGDA